MVKTMSKQQLHTLIDMTPESLNNILYEVLIRFVPVDFATPEEIEAIKEGRQQIANGEYEEFDASEWL